MNKEILWLPGWYPNKLDAFTGDFIQRHAKALSLFLSVHVVYIVRDNEKKVTTSVKIEENKSGNLTETIIYYAIMDFPVTAIEKLLSLSKFNSVYKKYFSELIGKNGLPNAVHVHVLYKSGLIALWLKRKYRLEYYLTEHWTGYDKTSPDNYYNRSASFRYITRKILKRAKTVIPVSEDLAKKLVSIAPSIKLKIIPNVVDETLFYFEKVNTEKFRFIHYVSSWKGQKNSERLIKIFSELLKKRNDWECILYGPAGSELEELVNILGLRAHVKFTGAISYEKVAELVRSASTFVSFSRYENQPCSILEALCCGVPVIGTKVGGVPEVINLQNGILVEPDNEDQMMQALETMMKNFQVYNRMEIAEVAKNRFSYNRVGKQLMELYQQ